MVLRHGTGATDHATLAAADAVAAAAASLHHAGPASARFSDAAAVAAASVVDESEDSRYLLSLLAQPPQSADALFPPSARMQTLLDDAGLSANATVSLNATVADTSSSLTAPLPATFDTTNAAAPVSISASAAAATALMASAPAFAQPALAQSLDRSAPAPAAWLAALADPAAPGAERVLSHAARFRELDDDACELLWRLGIGRGAAHKIGYTGRGERVIVFADTGRPVRRKARVAAVRAAVAAAALATASTASATPAAAMPASARSQRPHVFASTAAALAAAAAHSAAASHAAAAAAEEEAAEDEDEDEDDDWLPIPAPEDLSAATVGGVHGHGAHNALAAFFALDPSFAGAADATAALSALARTRRLLMMTGAAANATKPVTESAAAAAADEDVTAGAASAGHKSGAPTPRALTGAIAAAAAAPVGTFSAMAYRRQREIERGLVASDGTRIDATPASAAAAAETERSVNPLQHLGVLFTATLEDTAAHTARAQALRAAQAQARSSATAESKAHPLVNADGTEKKPVPVFVTRAEADAMAAAELAAAAAAAVAAAEEEAAAAAGSGSVAVPVPGKMGAAQAAAVAVAAATLRRTREHAEATAAAIAEADAEIAVAEAAAAKAAAAEAAASAEAAAKAADVIAAADAAMALIAEDQSIKDVDTVPAFSSNIDEKKDIVEGKSTTKSPSTPTVIVPPTLPSTYPSEADSAPDNAGPAAAPDIITPLSTVHDALPLFSSVPHYRIGAECLWHLPSSLSRGVGASFAVALAQSIVSHGAGFNKLSPDDVARIVTSAPVATAKGASSPRASALHPRLRPLFAAHRWFAHTSPLTLTRVTEALVRLNAFSLARELLAVAGAWTVAVDAAADSGAITKVMLKSASNAAAGKSAKITSPKRRGSDVSDSRVRVLWRDELPVLSAAVLTHEFLYDSALQACDPVPASRTDGSGTSVHAALRTRASFTRLQAILTTLVGDTSAAAPEGAIVQRPGLRGVVFALMARLRHVLLNRALARKHARAIATADALTALDALFAQSPANRAMTDSSGIVTRVTGGESVPEPEAPTYSVGLSLENYTTLRAQLTQRLRQLLLPLHRDRRLRTQATDCAALYMSAFELTGKVHTAAAAAVLHSVAEKDRTLPPMLARALLARASTVMYRAAKPAQSDESFLSTHHKDVCAAALVATEKDTLSQDDHFFVDPIFKVGSARATDEPLSFALELPLFSPAAKDTPIDGSPTSTVPDATVQAALDAAGAAAARDSVAEASLAAAVASLVLASVKTVSAPPARLGRIASVLSPMSPMSPMSPLSPIGASANSDTALAMQSPAVQWTASAVALISDSGVAPGEASADAGQAAGAALSLQVAESVAVMVDAAKTVLLANSLITLAASTAMPSVAPMAAAIDNDNFAASPAQYDSWGYPEDTMQSSSTASEIAATARAMAPHCAAMLHTLSAAGAAAASVVPPAVILLSTARSVDFFGAVPSSTPADVLLSKDEEFAAAGAFDLALRSALASHVSPSVTDTLTKQVDTLMERAQSLHKDVMPTEPYDISLSNTVGESISSEAELQPDQRRALTRQFRSLFASISNAGLSDRTKHSSSGSKSVAFVFDNEEDEEASEASDRDEDADDQTRERSHKMGHLSPMIIVVVLAGPLDIIFAEQSLACGVAVHSILPMPLPQFPPLASAALGWLARAAAVAAASSTVTVAVDSLPSTSDEASAALELAQVLARSVAASLAATAHRTASALFCQLDPTDSLSAHVAIVSRELSPLLTVPLVLSAVSHGAEPTVPTDWPVATVVLSRALHHATASGALSLAISDANVERSRTQLPGGKAPPVPSSRSLLRDLYGTRVENAPKKPIVLQLAPIFAAVPLSLLKATATADGDATLTQKQRNETSVTAPGAVLTVAIPAALPSAALAIVVDTLSMLQPINAIAAQHGNANTVTYIFLSVAHAVRHALALARAFAAPNDPAADPASPAVPLPASSANTSLADFRVNTRPSSTLGDELAAVPQPAQVQPLQLSRQSSLVDLPQPNFGPLPAVAIALSLGAVTLTRSTSGVAGAFVPTFSELSRGECVRFTGSPVTEAAALAVMASRLAAEHTAGTFMTTIITATRTFSLALHAFAHASCTGLSQLSASSVSVVDANDAWMFLLQADTRRLAQKGSQHAATDATRRASMGSGFAVAESSGRSNHNHFFLTGSERLLTLLKKKIDHHATIIARTAGFSDSQQFVRTQWQSQRVVALGFHSQELLLQQQYGGDAGSGGVLKVTISPEDSGYAQSSPLSSPSAVDMSQKLLSVGSISGPVSATAFVRYLTLAGLGGSRCLAAVAQPSPDTVVVQLLPTTGAVRLSPLDEPGLLDRLQRPAESNTLSNVKVDPQGSASAVLALAMTSAAGSSLLPPRLMAYVADCLVAYLEAHDRAHRFGYKAIYAAPIAMAKSLTRSAAWTADATFLRSAVVAIHSLLMRPPRTLHDRPVKSNAAEAFLHSFVSLLPLPVPDHQEHESDDGQVEPSGKEPTALSAGRPLPARVDDDYDYSPHAGLPAMAYTLVSAAALAALPPAHPLAILAVFAPDPPLMASTAVAHSAFTTGLRLFVPDGYNTPRYAPPASLLAVLLRRPMLPRLRPWLSLAATPALSARARMTATALTVIDKLMLISPSGAPSSAAGNSCDVLDEPINGHNAMRALTILSTLSASGHATADDNPIADSKGDDFRAAVLRAEILWRLGAHKSGESGAGPGTASFRARVRAMARTLITTLRERAAEAGILTRAAVENARSCLARYWVALARSELAKTLLLRAVETSEAAGADSGMSLVATLRQKWLSADSERRLSQSRLMAALASLSSASLLPALEAEVLNISPAPTPDMDVNEDAVSAATHLRHSAAFLPAAGLAGSGRAPALAQLAFAPADNDSSGFQDPLPLQYAFESAAFATPQDSTWHHAATLTAAGFVPSALSYSTATNATTSVAPAVTAARGRDATGMLFARVRVDAEVILTHVQAEPPLPGEAVRLPFSFAGFSDLTPDPATDSSRVGSRFDSQSGLDMGPLLPGDWRNAASCCFLFRPNATMAALDASRRALWQARRAVEDRWQARLYALCAAVADADLSAAESEPTTPCSDLAAAATASARAHFRAYQLDSSRLPALTSAGRAASVAAAALARPLYSTRAGLSAEAETPAAVAACRAALTLQGELLYAARVAVAWRTTALTGAPYPVGAAVPAGSQEPGRELLAALGGPQRGVLERWQLVQELKGVLTRLKTEHGMLYARAAAANAASTATFNSAAAHAAALATRPDTTAVLVASPQHRRVNSSMYLNDILASPQSVVHPATPSRAPPPATGRHKRVFSFGADLGSSSAAAVRPTDLMLSPTAAGAGNSGNAAEAARALVPRIQAAEAELTRARTGLKAAMLVLSSARIAAERARRDAAPVEALTSRVLARINSANASRETASIMSSFSNSVRESLTTRDLPSLAAIAAATTESTGAITHCDPAVAWFSKPLDSGSYHGDFIWDSPLALTYLPECVAQPLPALTHVLWPVQSLPETAVAPTQALQSTGSRRGSLSGVAATPSSNGSAPLVSPFRPVATPNTPVKTPLKHARTGSMTGLLLPGALAEDAAEEAESDPDLVPSEPHFPIGTNAFAALIRTASGVGGVTSLVGHSRRGSVAGVPVLGTSVTAVAPTVSHDGFDDGAVRDSLRRPPAAARYRARLRELSLLCALTAELAVLTAHHTLAMAEISPAGTAVGAPEVPGLAPLKLRKKDAAAAAAAAAARPRVPAVASDDALASARLALTGARWWHSQSGALLAAATLPALGFDWGSTSIVASSTASAAPPLASPHHAGTAPTNPFAVAPQLARRGSLPSLLRASSTGPQFDPASTALLSPSSAAAVATAVHSHYMQSQRTLRAPLATALALSSDRGLDVFPSLATLSLARTLAMRGAKLLGSLTSSALAMTFVSADDDENPPNIRACAIEIAREILPMSASAPPLFNMPSDAASSLTTAVVFAGHSLSALVLCSAVATAVGSATETVPLAAQLNSALRDHHPRVRVAGLALRAALCERLAARRPSSAHVALLTDTDLTFAEAVISEQATRRCELHVMLPASIVDVLAQAPQRMLGLALPNPSTRRRRSLATVPAVVVRTENRSVPVRGLKLQLDSFFPSPTRTTTVQTIEAVPTPTASNTKFTPSYVSSSVPDGDDDEELSDADDDEDDPCYNPALAADAPDTALSSIITLASAQLHCGFCPQSGRYRPRRSRGARSAAAAEAQAVRVRLQRVLAAADSVTVVPGDPAAADGVSVAHASHMRECLLGAARLRVRAMCPVLAAGEEMARVAVWGALAGGASDAATAAAVARVCHDGDFSAAAALAHSLRDAIAANFSANGGDTAANPAFSAARAVANEAAAAAAAAAAASGSPPAVADAVSSLTLAGPGDGLSAVDPALLRAHTRLLRLRRLCSIIPRRGGFLSSALVTAVTSQSADSRDPLALWVLTQGLNSSKAESNSVVCRLLCGRTLLSVARVLNQAATLARRPSQPVDSSSSSGKSTPIEDHVDDAHPETTDDAPAADTAAAPSSDASITAAVSAAQWASAVSSGLCNAYVPLPTTARAAHGLLSLRAGDSKLSVRSRGHARSRSVVSAAGVVKRVTANESGESDDDDNGAEDTADPECMDANETKSIGSTYTFDLTTLLPPLFPTSAASFVATSASATASQTFRGRTASAGSGIGRAATVLMLVRAVALETRSKCADKGTPTVPSETLLDAIMLNTGKLGESDDNEEHSDHDEVSHSDSTLGDHSSDHVQHDNKRAAWILDAESVLPLIPNVSQVNGLPGALIPLPGTMALPTTNAKPAVSATKESPTDVTPLQVCALVPECGELTAHRTLQGATTSDVASVTIHAPVNNACSLPNGKISGTFHAVCFTLAPRSVSVMTPATNDDVLSIITQLLIRCNSVVFQQPEILELFTVAAHSEVSPVADVATDSTAVAGAPACALYFSDPRSAAVFALAASRLGQLSTFGKRSSKRSAVATLLGNYSLAVALHSGSATVGFATVSPADTKQQAVSDSTVASAAAASPSRPAAAGPRAARLAATAGLDAAIPSDNAHHQSVSMLPAIAALPLFCSAGLSDTGKSVVTDASLAPKITSTFISLLPISSPNNSVSHCTRFELRYVSKTVSGPLTSDVRSIFSEFTLLPSLSHSLAPDADSESESSVSSAAQPACSRVMFTLPFLLRLSSSPAQQLNITTAADLVADLLEAGELLAAHLRPAFLAARAFPVPQTLYALARPHRVLSAPGLARALRAIRAGLVLPATALSAAKTGGNNNITAQAAGASPTALVVAPPTVAATVALAASLVFPPAAASNDAPVQRGRARAMRALVRAAESALEERGVLAWGVRNANVAGTVEADCELLLSEEAAKTNKAVSSAWEDPQDAELDAFI